MIRIINLLWGVLLSLSTFGQLNSTLNFHQLTSTEGLSQGTNAFLHTDKSGSTWISSTDGLNLFDGEKTRVFKTVLKDSFAMKGVNIQSPFFEESNGNIWFTTSEAINCYRREKGVFTHDFARGPDPINIGIHNAFYLEKDRFLWLINDEQLYRYDTHLKDSLTRAAVLDGLGNAVRCAVTIDKNKQVKYLFNAFWSAQQGFELVQFSATYEPISRQVWFDSVGHPTNYTLEVTKIITEGANLAWMVTNKGLLYFNAQNPKDYQLIKHPSPKCSIKSISSYTKDLFWVLLDDSTITIFDKRKKEFLVDRIQLFNLDKRTKLEGVSEIFYIRDSMLWVACNGAGVYFSNIANQLFTSLFHTHDLGEHSVDQIYEFENGNILCSSSNSKKGWLFDQEKNFLKEIKLPMFLKKITVYDQHIWNVSLEGLRQYLPKQDRHKLVIKANTKRTFNKLIALDENFLILAENDGINFFDIKKSQSISTDSKDFTIQLFVDHQKRLWSANTSAELFLWEMEEGDIPTLSQKKRYSNLGTILHIVEDIHRNIIWVGTSKGLARIDAKTLAVTQINETDGLPNQYINAIALDLDNQIWLSTNKGLIRYIPEVNKNERFKHFTTDAGLSTDEYFRGSVLFSTKNEIWFGSTKGVDIFDPKQIRNVGRAPQLAISDLQINQEKWNQEKTINSEIEIQLDYDENDLVFHLAAMEYTNPSRNQFKVFMEYKGSIDTSFLGTENIYSRKDLAPGEYQFSFIASNAEGIWQTQKKELKIIIDPHFSQTWWFRCLLVLAAIGIVSFISTFYYRYQLRSKALELEKQERIAERKQLVLEKKLSLQMERTRISGEMHDEIGGGLSTIRNATAKVKKKESIDEVKKILTRVSEISINLISNIRGIIWAMDPDYDSLEDLCAYLRRYVREYLDDNDLSSTIEIPEELPNIEINGQARHNLALTVKEALHNIVKHAAADHVVFKLSFDENLIITIADNGKGFEKEKLKRKGHGLRNMTNRMKTIGAKLDWLPLKPKGMMVKVLLPLSSQ